MARVSRAPTPPGVWTLDVAIGWLQGLGIPGDRRAKLVRGPRMPDGVDRVVRATPAPGARAGRGAGEESSQHESWKALQLAFRGVQADESDRDAELLAVDAHQRLVTARTGVWVPAGTGRVWLPREGLSWPSGGPSPMGPVPDGAERHLWTCTYLVHVIEYPTRPTE